MSGRVRVRRTRLFGDGRDVTLLSPAGNYRALHFRPGQSDLALRFLWALRHFVTRMGFRRYELRRMPNDSATPFPPRGRMADNAMALRRGVVERPGAHRTNAKCDEVGNGSCARVYRLYTELVKARSDRNESVR